MTVPQAMSAPAAQSDIGPVEVMSSCFAGASGTAEFNFMLRPSLDAGFSEQLAWLESALQDTLERNGLDRRSIVFRRFFCGDAPGQVKALQCHLFSSPGGRVNGATSLVIQPPAQPAALTLWVYCISDLDQQVKESRHGSSFSLKRGELEHTWTTGLVCTEASGIQGQTRAIFDTYIAMLENNGMNLQYNCLRTWFYIRDVDHSYPGFVDARNEVFADCGLTPLTHYIASTGIQASFTDARALLMMDAYAIKGVKPQQVRHLKAPDYLSATDVYGVAFERATQVSYRDRRHIIISGTASIDSSGAVVHDGNVSRQLGRALENIAALLARAEATLDDMQHFIAYVRRPGDAALVSGLLQARIGGKPFLVVTGPVCRPGCLVEIEGIAITANGDDSLPDF